MAALGFTITALDPGLREIPGARACVCLGLGVRHVVSLVNIYWFTVPGAEYDAATFHAAGARFAVSDQPLVLTVGSNFYEELLGTVYRVLGDSLFVGQSLSVLTFAVTCMMLVRILGLAQARPAAPLVLLVMALWPSAIIFGSITLREPFQLMLFVVAVYAGLRLLVHGRWWGIPVCAAGFLAMGLFHQLLLVYGILAFMLVAGFAYIKAGLRRGIIQAALVVCSIAAAFGFLTMTQRDTPAGDDYIGMLQNRGVEAVVRYRRDIDRHDPRTAYGVVLDGSSNTALVLSGASIYMHYLAAPWPWALDRAIDAVPAAEAVFRIVLLTAMLAALWCKGPVPRRPLMLLLMLYVSMTILWAAGTTNYGQAMRHHLLTDWILIVAGIPWLLASVRAGFNPTKAIELPKSAGD